MALARLSAPAKSLWTVGHAHPSPPHTESHFAGTLPFPPYPNRAVPKAAISTQGIPFVGVTPSFAKNATGRKVGALLDGPVWPHSPTPGWEEALLTLLSPLPSPGPSPRDLDGQGSQAQGRRRKDTPTGK